MHVRLDQVLDLLTRYLPPLIAATSHRPSPVPPLTLPRLINRLKVHVRPDQVLDLLNVTNAAVISYCNLTGP